MRTAISFWFCLNVLGLTAQSAVNDATFNPGDVGFGIGSGFLKSGPVFSTNGVGNCMIALADNRMLIGGNWDATDAWLVKKLVRLNTDGSIDFTFNTGTGFNGEVYCMLQQPDGKIVVGGAFTEYSGTPCNHICRLELNGTIDPTFSSIPGCDAAVRDVLYVPGNKLVVGGDFTSANAAARNKIARLDLNGVNDPTFNVGGSGVVGQVRCLALQADGKIVVGGLIASYNGTARNNLLRINANGSIDATYLATAGAGPNGQVNDVVLQGSFHVIAGSFAFVSGVARDVVARLSSTGSVDGTLLDEGFPSGTTGMHLGVLTDGSVLYSTDYPTPLGQNCGSYDLAGNGGASGIYWQMASSFGSTLHILYGGDPGGWLFAQQSDGKIVMLMEGDAGGVERFNPDGTFDPTYQCIYGLAGRASQGGTGAPAIELSVSDHLWFGNIAQDMQGPAYLCQGRLANGQVDPSFISSTLGDNFKAMTARSDGKIVFVDSYNTFRLFGIDGTYTGIGHSIGSAPEIGAERNSVACYNDGRFLIAGFVGGFEPYLAHRYTSAGVHDASFTGPQGPGKALCVALGTSGAVFLGGDFTILNGITRNRIVRLTALGAVDPGFDPLGGFDGDVNDIALQADGKLLCTGQFSTYRGTSVPGVCRLNADASLDATFNVGTGLDGEGHKLLVRADGLIFVAGKFTQYKGEPRGSLVAINSDGSVNATFDTGVGFRDNYGNAALVSDFVIQSTGQIVAVGEFTQYQGIGRNRIARLGEGYRVSLAPRMFLEGCIISPLMCDELRLNNLIPLITPYRSPDFAQLGSGNEVIRSSVLQVQGNNAIVDWVYVGLSTSPSRQDLVATRSALLQRDGDVVDLDGVSPLTFYAPPGAYHVLGDHRNHLPVVTSFPSALSMQTTAVDFSNANLPTYGTDAQKFVGNVRVLWAGDENHDGQVKYTGNGNDRDPILVLVGGSTPSNTTSGYLPGDINMDGVVKYTGQGNDRDPILVNIGGTTPNAVRNAQLP